MISVVNYGCSNFGAMLNMLGHIGVEHRVVETRQAVAHAESLILPGVGAFDQGMAELEKSRLIEAIQDFAASGRPMLGVCLGMQLLGRKSEEGNSPGLGILDASTVKLRPKDQHRHRVPHIGWSSVKAEMPHPLIGGLANNARFYFVHSFHVVAGAEATVATCDYGETFCAAVAVKNVMGVQFHPEKSHRFGMQLLRNFARM